MVGNSSRHAVEMRAAFNAEEIADDVVSRSFWRGQGPLLGRQQGLTGTMIGFLMGNESKCCKAASAMRVSSPMRRKYGPGGVG